MNKFFLRLFLIIFIVLVSGIIFLSYFGLETERFNGLIKSKANEVNRHIKIEFNKIKIHLNPAEFNLTVKLKNPKILIKNNEIILSKLDLFLPIRSFVTSDFMLKRAEVAFFRNDIKDLTKITNIFLPKILNKKLNKVFNEGSLEGEFVIPFRSDGSIGKEYGFSGKVSDASINITKEFSFKNLTAIISHERIKDSDSFEITINKGNILDLELADSKINLIRSKNGTNIKNLLRTKGSLNYSQIKKIADMFNLRLGNLKNIDYAGDIKTNINFDLNNKFKLKNLIYSSEGFINSLKLEFDEQKILKTYLPNIDSKLVLTDTKFKLKHSQTNQLVELNGSVKKEELYDNFKVESNYNYTDKSFNIKGNIDLTNSEVEIPRLNYKKKINKEAELNFNVKFILDKYFKINSLNFISEKTNILVSKVELNNNFEVNDFKKLIVKTANNNSVNNDFLIEKLKEVVILGNLFDAEPLLKNLYKKSDKKTFSKKFNAGIKINFDKVLTGTDDILSDMGMIASINKGSYEKLSLKGNFSKDEIIEMSIYQIDKDKKTLHVISDRARPFIKNFDFIKGFEGGKLEYESISSDKISNSNLAITDFKVSEVPALAKLLTLASLQGIADTLSGEGIRFDSFEMKTNSKGNVLNIEDALAMGPAVSILLSGYVIKENVVSLRGTLVPATMLNSIIASIPVVGEILVGKKTGEGVVGVSFKMKGPPKNIKTTVNPIKTLTPRFIVRAVEKMKNKKKEEAK